MRICASITVAALVLSASAGATTWHVPGQIPTIRAAIDTATGGDVIALADVIFIGDGNRDMSFRGKAITVESASGNAGSCIINCEGTPGDPHCGFIFDQQESSDSVLRNITILDGFSDAILSGGAISIGDPGGAPHAPTIQGCIFLGNRAGGGGAIVMVGYDTRPIISGCTFDSNTAGDGGALHCDTVGPTVENCVFQFNSAEYGGGACSFVNVFVGNTANEHGGGVVAQEVAEHAGQHDEGAEHQPRIAGHAAGGEEGQERLRIGPGRAGLL